jgi:hypothetical protein
MQDLTELVRASAKVPSEREKEAVSISQRIAEIEADPRYRSGAKELHNERSRLYNLLRELR